MSYCKELFENGYSDIRGKNIGGGGKNDGKGGKIGGGGGNKLLKF